jgi:hypothetical protein
MLKQSLTTEGDKRRAGYFYIFISELKIITTSLVTYSFKVHIEYK